MFGCQPGRQIGKAASGKSGIQHRFGMAEDDAAARRTFFVAQSWAGCITDMPGFNL
jgi:hypothetical protein